MSTALRTHIIAIGRLDGNRLLPGAGLLEIRNAPARAVRSNCKQQIEALSRSGNPDRISR
jgi:hypothetical protein